MDISYRNGKLEKLFNSEKELHREYGTVLAKKIMIRQAFLKETKHLALVPVEKPTRRHKLSADRDGQWSVDLDENYRLYFEPVTDGNVKEGKLEEITAIRIIEVGDPHS